ncbi:MAG: hypothetical protein EOO14_03105 [Chitinophagaceae bacterium]|nr:MAG: hypothetical protein EOO14_03105 [Chitinophagaceae bacterium]
MSDTSGITFIISRLHVTLKVDIKPNRLVSITPYRCSEENLRLWKGISQAQAMQAQFTLDSDKKASPQQAIHSHFTRKGWTVEEMEN